MGYHMYQCHARGYAVRDALTCSRGLGETALRMPIYIEYSTLLLYNIICSIVLVCMILYSSSLMWLLQSPCNRARSVDHAMCLCALWELDCKLAGSFMDC